MPDPIHSRDHIPLTRMTRIVPGDDAFATWQAGLAARRAEAIGPPHPREAARLAEQERILFGRVRTRGLLRGTE